MLYLLLFLFISVKADFELDGFTYRNISSESNKYAVQVVNCSLTSEIKIPSLVMCDGINYTVISISTNAFSFSRIKQINAIFFPYTLTEIEDKAFYSFSCLENIGYINENEDQINNTLPPLLTKINNFVFSYCTKLQKIDVNKVSEFGISCFQNCIFLSDIQLDSVEIIGPYSLSNTSFLQSIELPYQLKEIQYMAFSNSSIVNITGNISNLQYITAGFFCCNQLQRIPYMSGILQLKKRSFFNCTSLLEIHCGKSLTSIHSECFLGCSNLVTFTTESQNYSISKRAFSGCVKLNSFNFDGVTKLLNYSFEGCVSLDTLNFNNCRLERINWHVFRNCGNLNSVILPPNLAEFSLISFEGSNVHSLTFSGTKSELNLTSSFKKYSGELKNVTFSPQCKVILDDSFSLCHSLEKVVLPKTPFKLYGTFRSCSKLTCVENINYCTEMRASFYACLSLAKINSLSLFISELGDETFSECISLISIPSLPRIERIGKKCFLSCFQLKNFNCGASLSEIGAYAFKNCMNIEEFGCKSTNFSISEQSFYHCYLLKGFNFSGCSVLSSKAFQKCISIEKVDMRDSSIDEIGSFCFVNCTSIRQIYFSNELKYIGSLSFSHCTSIKEIRLVEVLFIFTRAFEFCTALEKVEFQYPPASISSRAFLGCTSLVSVDLISSNSYISVYIKEGAFENCTSLKSFEFEKWPLSSIESRAFFGCPLSKKLSFHQSRIFYELNISSYAFTSSKIKTIDFRSTFYLLNIDNTSFSESKNIKCVMIENELKPRLEYIFDKNIINGIRCPNYLISHITILAIVIVVAVLTLFIIMFLVIYFVRKKRHQRLNTQTLLSMMQGQFQ